MTETKGTPLDPEIRRINLLRHWQRLRTEEPALWAFLTEDVRAAHKQLEEKVMNPATFCPKAANTDSTTNLLTIEGQQVRRLTYKGMPVITLADVDRLHAKGKNTAQRAFARNKRHFATKEDYILALPTESNADIVSASRHGGPRREMVLLTESGYLLLAKTFTDDLSWRVQKTLVNCYFKVKAAATPTPAAPKAPHFECDNSDSLRTFVSDWLHRAARKVVPADKFLMNENAAIRIFHIDGKGECITALDINRACGHNRNTVSNSKNRNPLAIRLVFKTHRPLASGQISHAINAVRVADVPALCLCKRPTPTVHRFARLMADYAAGLATTYQQVPALRMQVEAAHRQLELPL